MGNVRAVIVAGCAGVGLVWLGVACSGGGGGNPNELCQDYTSYFQACGSPLGQACVSAFESQCTQFVSSLSSVTIAAEQTCLSPPYQCDAGLALAECFTSKIYAASPTAAQQKVRADFCATCPDGKSTTFPTSCTDFFPSGAPDGSLLYGPGLFVLEYSVSIATQFDQMCTSASDAGDCASAFFTCAAQVVSQAVALPSACYGDAGKD
jgi:hypothetical protein